MTAAPAPTRTRLVVLGGGFAGVAAAQDAAKTGLFDVTLVSDRDFLHLYPISIWIPTRTVATSKTRVPLAKIAKTFGFEVVLDTVERVDTATSTVVLAGQTLAYDQLVFALGPGKAKPDGWEHTVSICSGPQGVLDLRDQLDALLEAGSGRIAIGFGGNPQDPSAVRGGPAFEMLFNIDHLLRKKGLRDRFQLDFFAPMANPGIRMGERAAAMMPKQLERLRIGMHTGTKIAGFDDKGVRFADGSRLDADLVMFIPGGVGHPVAKASGLPVNGGGFITIDDHCLVAGTDNVYAVGDSAAIQGPDWRAKQGHLAEVMARFAVANIVNGLKGDPERHSYIGHVSIVCLMDTGNGGMMVARTGTREVVLPLPVVGNWMKRGWGLYARAVKEHHIPRLPGM